MSDAGINFKYSIQDAENLLRKKDDLRKVIGFLKNFVDATERALHSTV